MALNPTASGDSHNWNYSKPENPGFATTLTGTVVAIQEVQAMNFGSDGRPTTPAFWDNSNQPKMNIRMVLCGPSGGFRTWTFQPAGKAAKAGQKKSVHLDLFALAGGKNLLDLLGKTIKVSTQTPPTGFNYGLGNPRPWAVELVADGPYALKEPLEPQYLVPTLLANTAVSGGAMAPQMSAGANFVPPAAQDTAAAPVAAPMADLGATEVMPTDCPF